MDARFYLVDDVTSLEEGLATLAMDEEYLNF